MARENAVLNKSFEFAIRIVKLHQFLVKEKKEYVLSKQLLRSGTSIGANVNEAQAGQSRNDFISKMTIASKEARESKYWIELLVATGYLAKNDKYINSLLSDVFELTRILTSIVKTTREK
ncbi:four helix bundle protein [Thiohalophilus sp.]|uniref:four helix bundle protein n=1 Tax=Thiohalophilus sp. TaxID=3028392 RepID=UPI002ACD4702|nr:four helix bundle protein [Thiohalophilus sp.]MDZ7662791.1 four helix bundle protein [Thiohalophilus sp.]